MFRAKAKFKAKQGIVALSIEFDRLLSNMNQFDKLSN